MTMSGSSEAETRRERAHRLVQLGILLEIAGLGAEEGPTLLGALLEIRKFLDDPQHQEERGRWKALGSAVLSERARDTTV